MDNKKKQEIKEVIQSCHVNFLFGAGTSNPFLPLLNGIEERLTNTNDINEKRAIKKEYFKGVMIPNLDVVNGTVEESKQTDLVKTLDSYEKFFKAIAHILLRRKSTLLSKQANVFTTNIDILMEISLEECGIEYNDGFSGRFNASFSLSNFKKSVFKRSMHFENISEIPVINLLKVHGSLNWKKNGDMVTFSKLDHFQKDLKEKLRDKFDKGYNQIAIVNPEKKKFEETVIDITYYELLRMFSSELEKENTVLFVVGFSMEDEHIREIIKRAADSNPTLRIYIFSHSQKKKDSYNTLLEIDKRRYNNVEVIIPVDDTQENKYTLNNVSILLSDIILDYPDSQNEHEDEE